MTDLQNEQYLMLREITLICEQLDISFFMVCGSALGTIKYQGFIPWDDDLDVGMYRNDYDKFCKYAPDLLPSNLFLQNFKSDKQYFQMYSKLRNSYTTYVESSVSNIDINHGVFVDIFVLDGYPKNLIKQKIFEVEKKIANLFIASSRNVTSKTKIYTRVLFGLMKKIVGFRFLRFIVTNLDKIYSSYSIDESNLICNHGNWQGKLEYAPKEQYGNGMWATFENLKVRIPEKYDEYLTQKYGDWRADLPTDQKIGHHYAELIDLNHPYSDYFVKLGKGKIRLKNSEELKN